MPFFRHLIIRSNYHREVLRNYTRNGSELTGRRETSRKSRLLESVEVKIGFDVQGIFAISEVDMDYQMTVYFRQTWKGKIGISRSHLRSWHLDPRLALGLNCSLNVRRQRLEQLGLYSLLFETITVKL